MNYFLKNRTLLSSIIMSVIMMTSSAYAAKISISAPHDVPPIQQPITVLVFLDAESDMVSGVSGEFSFPSDLFTIESLSDDSSIVSLWVTPPSLSQDKYIDGRTHINFEGIFPGGYSGVRSPYYQGSKPGVLFAVNLIPKNKGQGTFVVDNLILNSFTADAKPLPVDSIFEEVHVPALAMIASPLVHPAYEVVSKTLTAEVTRDVLVNRNAWYLVINEREQKSPIAKIYVAETNDYTAELVNEKNWRETSVPYVLLYQDRTKYIHTKVMYANNTYALVTVPPVENSHSISVLSRILISIIIVLSLVSVYGKKLFTVLQK